MRKLLSRSGHRRLESAFFELLKIFLQLSLQNFRFLCFVARQSCLVQMLRDRDWIADALGPEGQFTLLSHHVWPLLLIILARIRKALLEALLLFSLVLVTHEDVLLMTNFVLVIHGFIILHSK